MGCSSDSFKFLSSLDVSDSSTEPKTFLGLEAFLSLIINEKFLVGSAWNGGHQE
jgi:hypothetical protein